MTVSLAVGSAGVKKVYAGNGVTTVFPITFPYGEVDEIHLYLAVDGAEPTEITTNFTVDEDALTVTYPVDGDPMPDDTYELTLIRETPISQEVDLIEGGVYSAEVEEGALDKLTRIVAEIREELDRAVKFPVQDDPTAEETSSAEFLADIEAFSIAAQSAAASAALSATSATNSKNAAAASAAAASDSEDAAAASAVEAAASAAAAAEGGGGTQLPATLAELKALAVVGHPFTALATDYGQVVFYMGVAVGGSLEDGFELI